MYYNESVHLKESSSDQGLPNWASLHMPRTAFCSYRMLDSLAGHIKVFIDKRHI